MAKEVVKTFRTISENEFYEKFKPVKNHLDTNAAFGGFMFETYGEELQYIRNMNQFHKDKLQIWTIIDAEGEICFVSGYHYVNRLGYLLTEELVPKNIEYDVELSKFNTEADSDGNESGPFDQLGYEQTSEE